MASLINLPGYQVGNALNFSGISQAIDSNRQNALAQRQMGMQEQQLGMQKQRFDSEQQKVMAQRVGGMAQMGMNEKDPSRRQAILDRIISMHPDKTKLGPEYLSADTAFPMLVQEAQGFQGDAARADIDLKRAHAEKFRREAATGGELPMSVKEWKYYSGLPDDQKTQYLTMKRAEKFLNTGTEHVRLNPVAPGGPPIASIPINTAAKAAQQAQGTEQGKAIVDLPKVQQNAATTLKYIDAVLNDQNLGNVTGAQGYLPTIRSASRDTEARIAQLGGRAFLSAFESLKGGGQITEVEGKKATEALARLTDLKQSDAGYKQALQDFRGEVMNLVRIAERRAQGAGPYVPPPGVPTDGVQRPNTDRLPPAAGWSIKRIE